MRELIALHLLAQAYSCDAYGAGGYGECVEEPTPSPSSNNSTSQSSQGSTSTQSTDQAQTDETKTEDSTGSTSQEPRPTQPSTLPQTSTGTTQAGEVGVPGYEFILLWSFVIAFVIALVIFLWRRHRRRQYSQFNGNDTFYPPGPQPPVGQ